MGLLRWRRGDGLSVQGSSRVKWGGGRRVFDLWESTNKKTGVLVFSWWADGGLRGAVDWIRPWVVVWFCWINKKKGPFDL